MFVPQVHKQPVFLNLREDFPTPGLEIQLLFLSYLSWPQRRFRPSEPESWTLRQLMLYKLLFCRAAKKVSIGDW